MRATWIGAGAAAVSLQPAAAAAALSQQPAPIPFEPCLQWPDTVACRQRLAIWVVFVAKAPWLRALRAHACCLPLVGRQAPLFCLIVGRLDVTISNISGACQIVQFIVGCLIDVAQAANWRSQLAEVN